MDAVVNRGVSKPACAKRSRMRALSRAASTAWTELCGRPRASAAAAASNVPASSTAMIAARGRAWAMAKIAAVRSKSGHPDACLRIAIAGRRGGQFVYELDLVASEDGPPGDLVVQTADLRVLVESGSAADLDGAVIDLDPSALGGAL